MQVITPKLCETYYFYTKGKTHPYKYVGTKGKNYVFDLYGKLIELTPARFNYLYKNCNMQGVEAKEPGKQPGVFSRLFNKGKTDKNA